MSPLRRVRRRIGRLPGVRPAYDTCVRARFALDVRITRARERGWSPREPRPAAGLDVVLLSFARPRNIQPIAERVLRCDFVERLVISNNDPHVHLEDHVRLPSSRARIVNQPEPRPPMTRFAIAGELPGRYFLALDDDVLLRADQIEALFRALLADPSTPHGFVGQVMERAAEGATVLPYRLVERSTARVDVLNRGYLFTAAHRDRFFALIQALYRRAPGFEPLRYGDDIALSFTGSDRPRVHDVGRVLYFPSGNDPSVARWLQPGFHEYRSAVYREVAALAAPGGDHVPTTSARAGSTTPA